MLYPLQQHLFNPFNVQQTGHRTTHSATSVVPHISAAEQKILHEITWYNKPAYITCAETYIDV